jgi:hypothetical protein
MQCCVYSFVNGKVENDSFTMAKKILRDYKRDKKKFLAPMNHMLQDRGWQVHYVDVNHRYEVIPEIIWLAILNEKFGINETSEVLSELIKTANELHNDSETFITGFASSWTNLKIEKSQFYSALEDKGISSLLSEGLSGFLHLFPESPLSVIVKRKEPYLIGELNLLKKIIVDLSDYESRETVFAMAHVIYTAVLIGRYQFSSQVDISPQKLVDYPNTFDSLKIASTLRASLRMFYGNTIKNSENVTNKYFWKRCLELEPCKIKTLDNV